MDDFRMNTTSSDLFKSLNEDMKIFTCVALRPNCIDSHGDIYSEEVVLKGAHSFLEHCLNTALQHEVEVEKSDVSVVESYIAPIDMEIGTGQVLKGDWVVSLKVHNDEVWKACKDGVFTGLSVGCTATLRNV